jgi:hypothetical protein
VLFVDGSISGVAPIDRLNQAISYFQKFRQAGGDDVKVDQYIKDAQKAIGQEKRHEELERRNKLRKASDDAKKAADEAKKAAEDSKKAAAAALRAEQERSRPAPEPSSGSKLSDPGPSPAVEPVPSEGDKLGGGGK